VTTDLPSAIPILQDNIASNQPLVNKCVPGAVALHWEHEELPPQVHVQLEAGLDVIVYVPPLPDTGFVRCVSSDAAWQTSPTTQRPFLLSSERSRASSSSAKPNRTDVPLGSSWVTRNVTPMNDRSGIAPKRSVSISKRLLRSTAQGVSQSKFG